MTLHDLHQQQMNIQVAQVHKSALNATVQNAKVIIKTKYKVECLDY
jgi:hypothetical protein